MNIELLFRNENLPEKLNVTIDPLYIDVIIEEKISKEIDVEPDMNESMIDKNYVVKSYDVNPKSCNYNRC